MMYEAQWANEQQTTVYLAFEGAWQSDEFADAAKNLNEMLSEVGHTVSVVIHLTEPQLISMEMVPQIRNFISIEHPNRDQMILVAPDGFLQGVSEVVRRAFGGVQPPYLHFATSLNDVDEILQP